jgi:hypothetical protein
VSGDKEALTAKLKPIVTMLTEALARDFAPAYRKAGLPYGDDTWIRTDEEGAEFLVSSQQLQKDVEAWLLNLEHEMDNDSDRQFAKMTAHMIRKNKGWTTLLTNRVIKRIG